MKKFFFFFVPALLVFNLLNAAEKNNIRFLMPPAVYSVPGHEMNIYFDNIVLVPNINNYLFDVDCDKGRQDKTRWRFTPDTKDVGKYPLSIKVLNEWSKVIADGKTELYVTPANAGEGKDISIMVVGDSLTDASVYPNELKQLFSEKGNPKVKFIGSHAGHGRIPDDSHVAHEGRGGWTWAAYCSRWTEPKDKKKAYRAKSPFLFLKDGKPQLDFQKYLDKYNGGKAPDFITVLLGCNDTFRATDENIEDKINDMFKYADMLIAEFRKASKNTQIGLLLLVPPTATQNAFGSNYKCGQTRWQYRRNQHRVVEREIEKYGNSGKDNIFLIPAYVNIDSVNNFPKKTETLSSRNKAKIARDSNGVHPAKEGYLQIADSIYAWLKYRLNQAK